MTIYLTEGAIAELSNMEDTASPSPIVQVVDLRLVNQKSERYRLLLSHGVHVQQGMLYSQNNGLVLSNSLQKGSIVQLTDCVCITVRGRKIIIVIDLNVILAKCDPIGEHRQYEQPPNKTSSAPVASSSAQVQPTMFVPILPSGGAVAKPNVSVETISGQPEIDRSIDSQSSSGFVTSNANLRRVGGTNAQAVQSKTDTIASNSHVSFNSYIRSSPSPCSASRWICYILKPLIWMFLGAVCFIFIF